MVYRSTRLFTNWLLVFIVYKLIATSLAATITIMLRKKHYAPAVMMQSNVTLLFTGAVYWALIT